MATTPQFLSLSSPRSDSRYSSSKLAFVLIFEGWVYCRGCSGGQVVFLTLCMLSRSACYRSFMPIATETWKLRRCPQTYTPALSATNLLEKRSYEIGVADHDGRLSWLMMFVTGISWLAQTTQELFNAVMLILSYQQPSLFSPAEYDHSFISRTHSSHASPTHTHVCAPAHMQRQQRERVLPTW